MDSSWTKVRQMVADRVLTRHLQDLHDQQVAMEKAQEQQMRRVERELRASRNRAGSMQIDSTDPIVPMTSKRHSMPFFPTPPTNGTPPPTTCRVPAAGDNTIMAGIDRFTLGLRPETATTTASPDDSGNLLDLMATTLHSARSMEQQRPSLYLQTPTLTGKPDKESSVPQTFTSKDRPFAASLRNQRAKAAAALSLSTPRLERGERFLQTDQSQVLSLETVSSLKEAPQKKGDKTTRKRQMRYEVSNSETEGQPTFDAADFGAKYAHPRRGSKVNVDFYDEDTGIKKDDGGFTPKDLPPLPLDMLEEENEQASDADDSVEEEEEQLESDKEELGLEEEKDPWSELKKCQYIRGYDPLHMRMPKDTVKFVFGDSGQT